MSLRQMSSLDLVWKRFWWVGLFAILCFTVYEQGIAKKNSEKKNLKELRSSLKQKKAQLSKNQEKLRLQVKSQSDPEWIELVLMRELGVVPDKQTKVYFPNG